MKPSRIIKKSWPLLVLLSIFLVGAYISVNPRSPGMSQEEDHSSSNLNTATISSNLHYYDDAIADGSYLVFNNSVSDNEYFCTTYSCGTAQYLVTGIRYYHWEATFAGPFTVRYTMGGDSGNFVSFTDSNIPAASSGSWRTFSLTGPTYPLDNDPEVRFYTENPSTNCMSLGYDAPAYSHSWYIIDGSSWTQDSGCEYMVDLIYESIPTLSVDSGQTGDISGGDYVDAYNVTLEVGKTYEFALSRTSGTGNLNMRLINISPTVIPGVRSILHRVPLIPST